MRCRDQDLPEDPSGRFHDFKDFVNSNDDVCQSIALLCFLTQGCGILLAPILRAVGKIKENSHENEDEYAEPTAPLLRPPELPPNSSLYPYVIGEPVNIEPQCLQDCFEFWKMKMKDHGIPVISVFLRNSPHGEAAT
ncbi:hypothetical protein T459_05659 [Capsicum annuum]|uniref:Uncharacterized protein n=1 Tax=Capsicum annuum TaxID=4072 RepID=A0A2G3A8H8_CAPAN|nr:hypothetical protein T459_05659 [Capsicum annuum]